MLAMINNAIHDFQPAPLIMGFTIFCVPFVMFVIHGIRDKRPVMFAVHSFLLAFLIFTVISDSEEFGKAFTAVLSDTGDLFSVVITLVISILFWYFVIRLFFRKKR